MRLGHQDPAEAEADRFARENPIDSFPWEWAYPMDRVVIWKEWATEELA